MGCESEHKIYVNGPCACCQLLDGDETKKEVKWCNVCRAHLCKPCEEAWDRRIVAFLKKRIKKYL